MAKLLLKKSSVDGNAAGTSDIDYGELAINFRNGRLFYKDNDNNIDNFIDSDLIQARYLGLAGGTLTGNLSFGDNDELRLGDGNDLILEHNGTNGDIRNSTNDLLIRNLADDKDVRIISDDGSGGTANYFRADGSTGEAQLFHYGTKKLNTESTGVDVNGNLTVSGTVDGRDVAADGTKLDGIEASATADQTASEILTAIKTVDGTGSGLDADTLDGVQGASFLRSDTDDTATGQIKINDGSANPLELERSSQVGIEFNDTSVGSRFLGVNGGNLYFGNNLNHGTNSKVWHEGNDGTGSGLDADTVDGIEATSFLRSDADDSFSGTITNGGTFVSSHNSGTPSTNLKFGRSGSQYYTFHGSSSGNFLTSVSATSNQKPWLKFGYSIDGGSTLANNYTLNGSSGTLWHTGNDGAGSGLDADLLDGQEGSYYRINVYDASGTLLN